MNPSPDKNSLTTQHTPTPWTIHIGARQTKDHWEPITIMGKTEDDEFWGVAQINVADDRDADMQSANAAFIVRAVNAHEQMLEALKAGMKMLLRNTLQDAEAYHQMKQAITQAEGKE